MFKNLPIKKCSTGEGIVTKYFEFWWFLKDPFPEFCLSLISKYLVIDLAFPARKYWYNFTNIFNVSLCSDHTILDKRYSLEFAITIIDLSFSIYICNNSNQFPSWMSTEYDNDSGADEND